MGVSLNLLYNPVDFNQIITSFYCLSDISETGLINLMRQKAHSLNITYHLKKILTILLYKS